MVKLLVVPEYPVGRFIVEEKPVQAEMGLIVSGIREYVFRRVMVIEAQLATIGIGYEEVFVILNIETVLVAALRISDKGAVI
jgi:hypothetical protein